MKLDFENLGNLLDSLGKPQAHWEKF